MFDYFLKAATLVTKFIVTHFTSSMVKKKYLDLALHYMARLGMTLKCEDFEFYH